MKKKLYTILVHFMDVDGVSLIEIDELSILIPENEDVSSAIKYAKEYADEKMPDYDANSWRIFVEV